MYKRICPKCKKELFYSNIKNRNKAEKNNVSCKECFFLNKKYETLLNCKKYNKRVLTDVQIEHIKKIWSDQKLVKEYVEEGIKNKKEIALTNKGIKWERICPKCKDIIIHTNKQNRNSAKKKKTLCSKCSHIIFGKNHTGKSNTFYGKTHSEESISKMKQTASKSEKRQKFFKKIRSEEYKKSFAERFSGKNNPRFGKGSLYDIWLKKYGEEEAEKRQLLYKERLSISLSGENNFWFGKTPPCGAGNGWSGWYKDWFFRSIHELSYMINIIEKEKLQWKSAECSEFKISYIDEKGKKRNYFADFIIENKKMIEVKPKRLQNTKKVSLKIEAGKAFCNNKMLEYEIIDPIMLTNDEVMFLYKNGAIKFTKTTEEKFVKKYLKN